MSLRSFLKKVDPALRDNCYKFDKICQLISQTSFGLQIVEEGTIANSLMLKLCNSD